ncbi:unnamed protein product [Thelazia callipaeda]|uniref:Uncharacterized protein n=1 Tax=Thelazia callipaeda TaxID=103827 RepID=A0A0N5D060_THECL|nr:unnamed protein product [Thelazia callipaeda]
MLRTIFFLGICVFADIKAQIAGLPQIGPISPYIGSVPSLARFRTIDQRIQEIVGRPTNFSNGFFWPPPLAVVAGELQKQILQSSGLSQLGLGGLGLSNLGLGGLNLGSLGLGGLGSLGLGSLGLRNLGLRSLEDTGLSSLIYLNSFGDDLASRFPTPVQIIRIPLSDESFTSQQCQAPCFLCSTDTPESSIIFTKFSKIRVNKKYIIIH